MVDLGNKISTVGHVIDCALASPTERVAQTYNVTVAVKNLRVAHSLTFS
jgi:hypothetical protein